ncbi:MAG: hypothetical protein PHX59_00985 [Sulfuricurvum sp.]|nr:hypothetical protein [Sulfuricurvum sp.]
MENLENVEMNAAQARRTFLKKAAYAAPVVIALGGLNAHAGRTVGSSVFSTNLYVGTEKTDANYIGTATVSGHNGVVDQGLITDTDGVKTYYTSAEVNSNKSPYAKFWNDFKSFFGTIN